MLASSRINLVSSRKFNFQTQFDLKLYFFNFFPMEQIKIGSGLQNLGNTCFFNAVMQSVLHTKKLASHFSNKKHSSNCQNKDWCVFCQMEKTYHTTRSNKVYSPYNIVNNLKKVFKKFKLGRQEDSHEFLRYLIQGMQDCETGKLGKDRQKNQASIKRTKIFNIFGGMIKNVVLCLSCKHKSITKQRYYDLNVECQRSNTLDEGIDRFFAADQLKGQNKYLCEHCKNRVDATKRFYLQTAPQTLTFQLKRFTNMLRKIGKFIKYPKFMHLGKYFDHERKTVARLFAVIVHAGGSASSGHYFSYVRAGEDWFRMDDSYVTKCSEEQAMNQNAYILLYQKIKDQSLQKQIKEDKKQQIKSDRSIEEIERNLKTIQRQFEKDKQISESKQQEKPKSANQKLIKQNILPKPVNGMNVLLDRKKDQKQKVLDDKNEFKRQAPVESDEDLLPPLTLQRSRSKQEAEQSMTIQQMLLKYATNLRSLQSKLPPYNLLGHRSLRSIYNLRKYEISMKKRKLF